MGQTQEVGADIIYPPYMRRLRPVVLLDNRATEQQSASEQIHYGQRGYADQRGKRALRAENSAF